MSFHEGDLVLAKLPSYPPWPAVVIKVFATEAAVIFTDSKTGSLVKFDKMQAYSAEKASAAKDTAAAVKQAEEYKTKTAAEILQDLDEVVKKFTTTPVYKKAETQHTKDLAKKAAKAASKSSKKETTYKAPVAAEEDDEDSSSDDEKPVAKKPKGAIAAKSTPKKPAAPRSSQTTKKTVKAEADAGDASGYDTDDLLASDDELGETKKKIKAKAVNSDEVKALGVVGLHMSIGLEAPAEGEEDEDEDMLPKPKKTPEKKPKKVTASKLPVQKRKVKDDLDDGASKKRVKPEKPTIKPLILSTYGRCNQALQKSYPQVGDKDFVLANNTFQELYDVFKPEDVSDKAFAELVSIAKRFRKIPETQAACSKFLVKIAPHFAKSVKPEEKEAPKSTEPMESVTSSTKTEPVSVPDSAAVVVTGNAATNSSAPPVAAAEISDNNESAPEAAVPEATVSVPV